MSKPLQIHYRGFEATDALDAYIEGQFNNLIETYQRQSITSCQVTVELLNHRVGKGATYRVMIELAVPGKRLVVGRDPGRHPEHLESYAALNAAFLAMERRLQEHMDRLRHDVKHHESPVSPAQVLRIFPQDGYGFLATADGREIYFNENSVLDDGFERLAAGSPVRFHEELGDEGPQASTVHVI